MTKTLLQLELLSGAAGLIAFCLLYSRRPWRSSDTGRQLMVMCAYWAAIILLRQVHDYVIPVAGWVFVVAWAPLSVIGWRWALLLWRRRTIEEE